MPDGLTAKSSSFGDLGLTELAWFFLAPSRHLKGYKQPIFFLPFVAVDAEAYAATQIVELGERTMRHFSVLLSAQSASNLKKNDQPLLAPTRAATLKTPTPAKV